MKKDEFKLLSEKEHVLLRPNMYIGSTSIESHSRFIDGKYQEVEIVPALLKIFDEILDNAVDEFIRTSGQHANKIDVKIENERSITIRDNGRGIPVEKVGPEYRPVLAWTRARAGTNFTDDDRTTMGMNGVGAFATNVFSESFVGETFDGKHRLVMTCSNNIDEINTKVRAKTTGSTYTEVFFVPDFKRLNLEKITPDHVKCIRERLKNLAVCFPGLQFKFNNERIAFRNVKQFADTFSPHNVTYNDDNSLIVIAPAGDDEKFRMLSYVNGLHIKNGGSHIQTILDGICAELRPTIKRRHKIDVLPNQIQQHLLLVSIIRNFPNPKFDSQTKERITNSRREIQTHLEGIDYSSIAKKIMNTPEILDPMIEAILYKKQMQENLALARQQRQIQKKRVVNHISATSKDPDEKTLFIAEGMSAIGQLINVRDPKTVGGYPLRGKVMNTRDMKPTDIAKNKEIGELMSIIGLELGQSALNLNYGQIVILTDADTDGSSIACLLLNFFSNWPALFEQKRIHICETPLYIAMKGTKDIKYYYTQTEYDAARDTLGPYEVDYAKGLGSLPKEVYRDVVNTPRLLTVTAESNKDWDHLEMAFGKNADARKKWLYH